MRDERWKEERSKQGQANNKAKQHSTPKAVTFPKKISCHVYTALPFLALYSHTQLSTSIFGSSPLPKQMSSWPAISSSSPSSYSAYIRLEWSGTKSVILHMPGGVECKYSL